MKLSGFLLIVVLLCTASGGCGYTASSLLPEGMDSIHVNSFVNKIDPAREVSDKRASYSYQPGLETDITRAVIDGFIFDRHLTIEREESSALLLKGTLTDFRLLPLSYDKNDNVVEFRIEIFVNLELYNNRTNELMWRENSFMGQSTYNISGPNMKTESEAIRDAVKDLSLRIVERTVEAW
ncbi:MAG: LPS assembly lipoprotein LptE [Candidatus Omnitrophota bacterium]